MKLSSFGVWTSPRRLGAGQGPAAAQVAEELGFGALWLGGSPRLLDLRPLLAATRELVVAAGVVNVWQYGPAELAGEFAELEADFPGRVLVGMGIGHPEATSAYAKPLAKISEFLDGLDAAPKPLPKDRRCLAALGPRMLELAAARTWGSHPYFVPVEHTRYARSRLGAGPLLAPEVTCVLDNDGERASATARDWARSYLTMTNYTSNLLRVGFDETDIAGTGSDRLIDAVVAHGNAEAIAAVASAHLAAGADHVCLQAVGVEGVPREEWTALARVLIT